jgi:hypothetical protein
MLTDFWATLQILTKYLPNTFAEPRRLTIPLR